MISIVDEIAGLGPLEALLADPTVSDILSVYINKTETISHG